MLASGSGVDTAVVFVHGLNGNPETTWIHFQTLVDRFADRFGWWPHCDLFFYSYESVAKPLRLSASKLDEFLTEIFPYPPTWLFRIPCDPLLAEIGIEGDIILRGEFQGYSKLIIAAHSEGAAIARLLILDRANEAIRLVNAELRETGHDRPEVEEQAASGEVTSSLPTKVRRQRIESFNRLLNEQSRFRLLDAELCLFAPAHAGSSITGPFGSLLEMPGINVLLRPLLRWSTASRDLEPSSPILMALRTSTERLFLENDWIKALCARVLWGEDEKIVFVDKFSQDSEEFVAQHDHTSVCKPSVTYLKPLVFVSYGQHTAPAGV